MNERPVADDCLRCEQPRRWHGSLTTNLEGQPPDREQHFFLCSCFWPPIQVLERKNGGEWAWRVTLAEHRR